MKNQLILKKSLFITVDRDDHLELVNINSVKIGEIIHVTSGERIPLDGIVLSGKSEVDNSIITGESNPQKITIGKIFSCVMSITLFEFPRLSSQIGYYFELKLSDIYVYGCPANYTN